MLILADTGVLLRLFEPADPLHRTAVRAVSALGGRGDTLTVAPQNLAEFWNVCTRPRAARSGLGLSVAEADRRLRALEATFPVLAEHPAGYGLWRGLVVAHAVRGRQVHDARLAALMLAHGITHVLTLNAGDFARFAGIVEVAPAGVGGPAVP